MNSPTLSSSAGSPQGKKHAIYEPQQGPSSRHLKMGNFTLTRLHRPRSELPLFFPEQELRLGNGGAGRGTDVRGTNGLPRGSEGPVTGTGPLRVLCGSFEKSPSISDHSHPPQIDFLCFPEEERIYENLRVLALFPIFFLW